MNIVSYLVSPGIRTLTMTDRDASCLKSLLDVDAHVVNCHDESEFLASLPGADIVLTWVFRQEWFSLAPRLRIAQQLHPHPQEVCPFLRARILWTMTDTTIASSVNDTRTVPRFALSQTSIVVFLGSGVWIT